MANILIVDDSLTIAKFVETLLLQAGHVVSVSVDANEAFRKLRIEKYDLILLDVVMPGKNGFQLCREIKTMDHHAKTPVIIMSTKNTDVDKYWGRKQGADDYLSKPIDADILMAAVNRFLGSPPSAVAKAQSSSAPHPAKPIQPPAKVTASASTDSTPATASSKPDKKTGARSFLSRFGFN